MTRIELTEWQVRAHQEQVQALLPHGGQGGSDDVLREARDVELL